MCNMLDYCISVSGVEDDLTGNSDRYMEITFANDWWQQHKASSRFNSRTA